MVRLYEAIMRYRPRPWDGPVVVYEAAIKPAITLPQFLERWRMIARQAERVRLQGNHVTIMREPRVAQLAADLERRITSDCRSLARWRCRTRPLAPASRQPLRASRRWMSVAFATAAALAAVLMARFGIDRAGAELGLRMTARLAFLFFWPSYAGGALVSVVRRGVRASAASLTRVWAVIRVSARRPSGACRLDQLDRGNPLDAHLRHLRRRRRLGRPARPLLNPRVGQSLSDSQGGGC